MNGTWKDRKKEEMERWEERRMKGQKEWKDGSIEEWKEDGEVNLSIFPFTSPSWAYIFV